MSNKKTLQSENITRKTYTYSLGGVTLSFNLRNDTKQEMKDFLELLGKATEDVTSELAKLSPEKKKK